MNAFKDAMNKAQAEADKWMQDNEHKLGAHEQADYVPSGTHKFESSHELYGAELEQSRLTDAEINKQIHGLIEAIDIDRGYYQETELDDTAIEQGGIFNVTTLSHWSKPCPDVGACEKSARSVWGWRDTGHNAGFKPKAYAKYQAKKAKESARYGIGFCYLNNGKTRAKLKSDDQTHAEAEAKVVTLSNLLDDLSF
jgi:hypothetical protein